MKYYIGRIEEINGGMEYSERFVFPCKGNPERHMDKVARDWRGSTKSDWDEDQGGYWADCTIVREVGCHEIPKADYDVLAKYIAVL